VDFELTDEQHALQEVVHDLVERDCPATLLRAVFEGRDDGSSFWKTLVSNDWPGLAIVEADGGSGATATELIIAIEQLGWGGDPTPFLATTTQYVPLVQECATADQRHELLTAVCGGGTGAAAFSAETVSATADGDGWLLSGTALHVMDADRADRIAVVASTGDGADGGLGVFVVAADDVTVTRENSFDPSLHVATVVFDGARVGADGALTGTDDVAAAVVRAGEWAVTGLSAQMVGACQRAFEIVLDHIKQRHQFGVPIGSFQAVKHMAVDVYVVIERARALAQFAALAIAEDDERRNLAPSLAKAAAGDCQRLTAKHGIQLFGGLGYTWENDIQLYVKRAKAGELLFGTTKDHRAQAGRKVMQASLAAAGTTGEDAR
jgi:alkylation response protein AidB-like acyl-CoA dehydrogenase